jgi:hypothetical protein
LDKFRRHFPSGAHHGQTRKSKNLIRKHTFKSKRTHSWCLEMWDQSNGIKKHTTKSRETIPLILWLLFQLFKKFLEYVRTPSALLGEGYVYCERISWLINQQIASHSLHRSTDNCDTLKLFVPRHKNLKIKVKTKFKRNVGTRQYDENIKRF